MENKKNEKNISVCRFVSKTIKSYTGKEINKIIEKQRYGRINLLNHCLVFVIPPANVTYLLPSSSILNVKSSTFISWCSYLKCVLDQNAR